MKIKVEMYRTVKLTLCKSLTRKSIVTIIKQTITKLLIHMKNNIGSEQVVMKTHWFLIKSIIVH